MKQIITGEQAISWGVRLARAEVIAAYPMTSRSRAVPELSGWCARGELKARFLQVESERSAVAACIGASSAGARTFAAASAQDLAGMHEGLHRAAGARLPIVMALAPDGTVSTNRDDSLSQRDTGWIQIHCEGNQELLDSTIQAFKLAEVVDLPVMVVLDAFQLANTGEPVDIPEAAGVDAFLPARADRQGLDANELRAHGAPAPPALHMEMRLRQQEAMAAALEALDAVDEEWGQRFGRRYGTIESHQTGGADLVLVASGTVASRARRVVDQLRAKGEPVGLVKVRLFRPFPAAAMRRALAGIPHVVALDRNLSPGRGGILAGEIRAALYDLEPGKRPVVHGCIIGPGGREAGSETILDCIARTREAAKNPVTGERGDIWVGVRP